MITFDSRPSPILAVGDVPAQRSEGAHSGYPIHNDTPNTFHSTFPALALMAKPSSYYTCITCRPADVIKLITLQDCFDGTLCCQQNFSKDKLVFHAIYILRLAY